jgi:hypothetical protein
MIDSILASVNIISSSLASIDTTIYLSLKVIYFFINKK